MKTDHQRLADYFTSVNQKYDTGEDVEGTIWITVAYNTYVFTAEGTYIKVEKA